MRIKMVSKLRKHDAAIMELGLEYSDKMAIPPGVLGFPLSGYCIAECTQTVIYDFSRLHLHLFVLSTVTVAVTGAKNSTFLCFFFSLSHSFSIFGISCAGIAKDQHHRIRVTIAYTSSWTTSFDTTFS